MLKKFLKNSLIVFLISNVFFYFIGRSDDLIWIYAFFGIIYAPIGGLLLTILDWKFNFSKIVYYLVAIVVTAVSFLVSMFIMFQLTS